MSNGELEVIFRRIIAVLEPNQYIHLAEYIDKLQQEKQQLKTTNESLTSLVNSCQKEIRELKVENHRLEYNEKILLKREERAINYIGQVIGYKSCAREIDEELNTLIGILRGGNNE